jgi:hypothetical protein
VFVVTIIVLFFVWPRGEYEADRARREVVKFSPHHWAYEESIVGAVETEPLTGFSVIKDYIKAS